MSSSSTFTLDSAEQPSILRSKPPGADYEFYDSVPLEPEPLAIRLLSILPGGVQDNIECTLECTILTTNPRYEALSYCWGPVDQLKRITVNQHALYVTPNLHAALGQLRRRDKVRRMWIDAICINQSSNGERMAQVSIMSSIYSSAYRTIAWLGSRADGSDLAFSVVREHLLGYLKMIRETSDEGEIERAVVKGRKKLGEKGIAAMRQVLTRSWFSRAWIIQEVNMSQEVVLYCGAAKATLLDFVTSLEVFTQTPEHGFSGDHLIKDTSWYERAANFAFLARDNGQWGQLSLVASRFRRFDATRPEDKLFALYGLCHDNVELLDLRPDYTLRPETVYTDVAFAMLTLTDDMRVLEVPRGSSSLRSKLPSWVPDWNDASRFGEGLTIETQGSRTLIDPINDSDESEVDDSDTESAAESDLSADFVPAIQRFSVSAGSAVSAMKRSEDNTLTIDALLWDSITELSAVMTELHAAMEPPKSVDVLKSTKWWDVKGVYKALIAEDRAQLEFYLQEWSGPCATYDEISDWHARFVAASKKAYPSGVSTEEAYVQTLCTGSLPRDTELDLEMLMEAFETWLKAWKSSSKWEGIGHAISIGSGKLGREAGAIISKVFAVIMKSSDHQELARAFSPTYRRRIARTRQGYFALVPAEAQVKDSIVLVKGGDLPLVMRQRPDKTTELVGESYVHGIMYGEAWDEERLRTIRIS